MRVHVQWLGIELGLGLGVIKVYREYRFTVRLWVQLCCEGKGEIEVQCYSEAWVTSMVTVRGQVKVPGLGLGLHV